MSRSTRDKKFTHRKEEAQVQSLLLLSLIYHELKKLREAIEGLLSYPFMSCGNTVAKLREVESTSSEATALSSELEELLNEIEGL